jgi:outer membrane protein TolC
VQAGILATRTPDTFTQQLARRIALSIQRIVGGEDAATIPVAFAAQERLAINVATARAIGAYPTWKLLTEADLIADEMRSRGRQLSLEQAIREAVEANLELAARDRAVAAGAEEVNLAKSILLPQVDVSADWSVIDPDRAEASLGLLPQREFSGSANFSQVLFAEPTWANYSAQRSVQESRVHDRETLRMDIALDAAVAYLNVLRAKTLERIERDNLRLTRANLETAELRVSVGAATLSEVYRWETRIASNRQAVIDATAQGKLTEIELNRVLHRPLEEAFETVETDLDDPLLVSSQERLYPYIDNPWSFEVFRQFMAREALVASPELRALRSLVSASGRVLQSTERSFWVPTFSFNAGLKNRFATSGAGSDAGATIPDLTPVRDLSWSFGLRLSYPLFTGSSRFAERAQAADELARLEFERDAVAERVEQRVRASLHQVGASYAGIDLSTDAANAAHNNYDLVLTAYTTGLASILDLLDAHNAALIADGVAANAVYDFLIDLMRMQRAAGRMGILRAADESESFFQRLEAFFHEVGGPVRR